MDIRRCLDRFAEGVRTRIFIHKPVPWEIFVGREEPVVVAEIVAALNGLHIPCTYFWFAAPAVWGGREIYATVAVPPPLMRIPPPAEPESFGALVVLAFTDALTRLV